MSPRNSADIEARQASQASNADDNDRHIRYNLAVDTSNIPPPRVDVRQVSDTDIHRDMINFSPTL